jgi:hypothetical protein
MENKIKWRFDELKVVLFVTLFPYLCFFAAMGFTHLFNLDMDFAHDLVWGFGSAIITGLLVWAIKG